MRDALILAVLVATVAALVLLGAFLEERRRRRRAESEVEVLNQILGRARGRGAPCPWPVLSDVEGPERKDG